MIDLRHVKDLKPADPYRPLGSTDLAAPFELTLKDSRKVYRLGVEASTVEKGSSVDRVVEANRDGWLALLASAIPDTAVSGSIRDKYRQVAMVTQLMRAHGAQPSAFKLTPAQWAKKSKAATKTTSKPAGKAGAVADRLAMARANRSKAGSNERAEPEEAGEMAMAPHPTASVVEESSAGAPLGRSTSLTMARALELQAESDAKDIAIEEHMLCWTESELVAYFQSGGSNSVAAAAPTSAPARPAEEAGNAQGRSLSWWFVRDADGSKVSGPHTDDEMRKRYAKGSVSHATHVRSIPCTEGPPPQPQVQQHEAFAPLQELCTANGPPFMDRA